MQYYGNLLTHCTLDNDKREAVVRGKGFVRKNGVVIFSELARISATSGVQKLISAGGSLFQKYH